MMSDREVWLRAGEIVAAHGNQAGRFVLNSVGDILCARTGVEDWRRVAGAVDAIIEAKPQ